MTTLSAPATRCTIIALLLITGACRPEAGTVEGRSTAAVEADPSSIGAEAGAVPDASYSVTGVVRSITPSGDHLIVAHDEIAGYMHAMTMPFAVSDTASIEGIATGDSVRFILRTGPISPVIHTVRKIR